MPRHFYKIENAQEYETAGDSDLIRMLPVPGQNALFIPKALLEALVTGISLNNYIHLSGPTGTAKSSIILALGDVPKNYQLVCRYLGKRGKKIKVYPIEMAQFETSAELYARRGLKDGNTIDEDSVIIEAFKDAQQLKKTHDVLIWLRELGRTHSSSVQGGLLDILCEGNIYHRNEIIDGSGIGVIADSNYQAEADFTHDLVEFDAALKRRLPVNITMSYLDANSEAVIIRELAKSKRIFNKLDYDIYEKTIQLGNLIREQQQNGNLRSIIPPNIKGYMTFLEFMAALKHMSPFTVAQYTMIGNATNDDLKIVVALFNEAFGIRYYKEDESLQNYGNLF